MDVRHFSTGSIETPDPFDKHLDQIGFYRKHTARDATCLFRVISEQMYDTQIYHPDVRDMCVRYMAINQSAYESVIIGTDLTYAEYLAKMSKCRTFGTLAELTALAYHFKRNVFLFEARTMGDWYVYEKEFKDTFLVFYTPPKHFDTVFHKSHIESVAFCQSLTYEILYSHVFKLPDVIYAVERMLHDPPDGTHVSHIEISPYDESQDSLTLSDGRHFILDHADETECILKNYLFCHFHNKQFEKILALNDFPTSQQGDADDWALSEHVYTSSLPRRNVSCVRQLLDENIKPFSYKVAKALDAHIYRNIEFDVWSEARKNARFRQWAQGDALQVGIKCLVENIDQTQKSSFCHIQEMRPHKNSCVVFVETLGEHRVVPLSSIKTIPSISWMVPNHHNHHRPEKKRKRNHNWHSNALMCKSSYKCSKIDDDAYMMDIHYFTKTMHIPQQYCEYITQPQYASNRFGKNDENTGAGGGGNNQQNNKNVQTKKSNQNQGGGGIGGGSGGVEKGMKTDNAKNAAAKQQRSVTAGDAKSGKQESLNVEFEPHVHYGNQPNMGYSDSTNTITFGHMDRGEMDGSTVPNNYGGHNTYTSLQSMIRHKDLLRSVYPPNLNAQPSSYPDGSDLQRVDIATVRFFYNLGHEFVRHMQYRFPQKAVTSMFHGILNESYQPRPNRYSGGYYDNYHDVGELANEFSRSVTFTGGRDQHTNKPNENPNQYRRPFNTTTLNAPKKGNRNYQYQYKGKQRQFGDAEPAQTKNNQQPPQQQQQTYNKPTDYAEAVPITESTIVNRANDRECEPSMMQATQHVYTYHDAGDPGNMYGVPLGYGMYPQVNENFPSYPVQVPGGVMFPEPLNVDSDLTQTYPYYNPHGTYYYSTPMPPFQMQQPQGSWYPPSIIPIQSTIPVPLQSSGSTVSAGPPPTTPSYPYVADAETATVQFAPAEPQ